MSKNDKWCNPIKLPNGNIVSGAVARNVRIAAFPQGLTSIVEKVARDAAEKILADASILATLTPEQRGNFIPAEDIVIDEHISH